MLRRSYVATNRGRSKPFLRRLILVKLTVGMTLASLVAGPLPAGEAHAKCPPHQADLAVTSISRWAFKVAPFCTFGTFAPSLPDGVDETPHNDARSMASASTVPCCSSIASPAPSHGGESANC